MLTFFIGIHFDSDCAGLSEITSTENNQEYNEPERVGR